MRLTKIVNDYAELYESTLFTGLVLGSWLIGMTTKLRGKVRRPVFRRVKFSYRFYGFMRNSTFWGLSNLPKYTQTQIKQALVALCQYATGDTLSRSVRDVLKHDMGYLPSKATLDRAEDYLNEHNGMAEQLPTLVRPPNHETSGPNGSAPILRPSSLKSAASIYYQRNPTSHPDYIAAQKKQLVEQLKAEQLKQEQPVPQEPTDISS